VCDRRTNAAATAEALRGAQPVRVGRRPDRHHRLTERDEHEQPEPLGEVAGIELHAAQPRPPHGRGGEIDERGGCPDRLAGVAVCQRTDDELRPR
jgi:hypothetical protein